jgi:hypothetical protein
LVSEKREENEREKQEEMKQLLLVFLDVLYSVE